MCELMRKARGNQHLAI